MQVSKVQVPNVRFSFARVVSPDVWSQMSTGRMFNVSVSNVRDSLKQLKKNAAEGQCAQVALKAVDLAIVVIHLDPNRITSLNQNDD